MQRDYLCQILLFVLYIELLVCITGLVYEPFAFSHLTRIYLRALNVIPNKLFVLVLGGRGTSPNIWKGVQHTMNKFTCADLRLCKNEGSKISKNNERGGSTGLKMKEKIYIKCFKTIK